VNWILDLDLKSFFDTISKAAVALCGEETNVDRTASDAER
jgi:hypothetical protein